MSVHVINHDANYISVITLSKIETWLRCIEADEAFVCDINAARLDAHECSVEVEKKTHLISIGELTSSGERKSAFQCECRNLFCWLHSLSRTVEFLFSVALSVCTPSHSLGSWPKIHLNTFQFSFFLNRNNNNPKKTSFLI